MSKGDRKKDYYIHRLVAQAFIPNPNNLLEINHIDGNKKNNCSINLEWVTRSRNNKHAFEMGLKKSMIGSKNPRAKKVVQYDLEMKESAIYDSIREIERRKGYRHSSIILCCQGKKETAYNYIWKYKEE